MGRPLFRDVSIQGYWNLGFVATAVALAGYCALSITSRGLFEYWGIDDRAFRVFCCRWRAAWLRRRLRPRTAGSGADAACRTLRRYPLPAR